MRFTIRSMLCAAFIILWLLMPLATGSWIIQSISQEVSANDVSPGLQNSIQVAGAPYDDAFIVQHIVQEAGVNDLDISEMAIIDVRGPAVTESNIPEDIIKIVDEIRSRDDDKPGIVFCKMNFPLISERSGDLSNETPEEPDELRTINDTELYEYTIILTEGKWDFGDAPDSQYHTLLASQGARHLIVPGFYIGKKIDAELNGQPHKNAARDDIDETDDEDGVAFTGPLHPGAKALIEITASCPGFLNAWMDFNGDGDWAEEGEKIFSDLDLDIGINHVSFIVPAKALQGDAYSRFRFSSEKGLSFSGPAPDGEVEDYCVGIISS